MIQPTLIERLKENLEWLAKEMKWFYAGTDSDDGNFYFRWYGRKDCGGMSVAKHLMVIILKNNEDVIVYWDGKRQFSNSLYRIIYEATQEEMQVSRKHGGIDLFDAIFIKEKRFFNAPLLLQSSNPLSAEIESVCLRIEQMRKESQ